MKMKQFTKVKKKKKKSVCTWSSSCVLYGRSQCVLLFIERTAYRVMEGVGLMGNNFKKTVKSWRVIATILYTKLFLCLEKIA